MTDLNEADVERRLARLREEYGEFPVELREETWTVGEFAESVELAESGYTGGGYVLAVREPDQAAPLTESMSDDDTQDENRVLLAMSRGSDRWGPPGGGREDGETYEEAAVREVREETGVEVGVTGIDGALRLNTTAEGDDRIVHTLYVVFTGRYESGHIRIQPGELNGAAWFRELPAKLHGFTDQFVERWDGGRVDRP